MRILADQPTPELPTALRGEDSHQGMVGGRLLKIMTRHTSHTHGMNLMDIAHKAKLPWQYVRLNLSKMEQEKTVRHYFRNEDHEWPDSLWYVMARPLGVKSAHCERGVESSNEEASNGTTKAQKI